MTSGYTVGIGFKLLEKRFVLLSFLVTMLQNSMFSVKIDFGWGIIFKRIVVAFKTVCKNQIVCGSQFF